MQWSDLKFFNFTTVQRQYTFRASVFEFGSFPGLAIHAVIIPGNAGAESHSSQSAIDQEHKLMTCLRSFCIHITILFFTFSVVAGKLREIFNM